MFKTFFKNIIPVPSKYLTSYILLHNIFTYLILKKCWYLSSLFCYLRNSIGNKEKQVYVKLRKGKDKKVKATLEMQTLSLLPCLPIYTGVVPQQSCAVYSTLYGQVFQKASTNEMQNLVSMLQLFICLVRCLNKVCCNTPLLPQPPGLKVRFVTALWTTSKMTNNNSMANKRMCMMRSQQKCNNQHGCTTYRSV